MSYLSAYGLVANYGERTLRPTITSRKGSHGEVGNFEEDRTEAGQNQPPPPPPSSELEGVELSGRGTLSRADERNSPDGAVQRADCPRQGRLGVVSPDTNGGSGLDRAEKPDLCTHWDRDSDASEYRIHYYRLRGIGAKASGMADARIWHYFHVYLRFACFDRRKELYDARGCSFLHDSIQEGMILTAYFWR